MTPISRIVNCYSFIILYSQKVLRLLKRCSVCGSGPLRSQQKFKGSTSYNIVYSRRENLSSAEWASPACRLFYMSVIFRIFTWDHTRQTASPLDSLTQNLIRMGFQESTQSVKDPGFFFFQCSIQWIVVHFQEKKGTKLYLSLWLEFPQKISFVALVCIFYLDRCSEFYTENLFNFYL